MARRYVVRDGLSYAWCVWDLERGCRVAVTPSRAMARRVARLLNEADRG